MAGPRIGVEIVADTTAFLKGLTRSARAAESFGHEMTKVSAAVNVSAQEQVAASVRTTEALRLQAISYRQIAAAAVEGSAEQVAAANLATRAEERHARALGVTAAETGTFAAQTGRLSRGALAGSGALKGFGRSIAFASTSFLGGAGLVAGVKASIGVASDLHEEISKTNVVFGQNSAAVQAWAQTSAAEMGLAEDQALATASSFGALFQPLGLVGQTAVSTSERLTQLGADLASFYNTDVASALDAIKSGLVGESEPLRRYGVLLSETRVQHEAMTETGKKNAKQLTAQEKVLARIALIFRDTGQAQGDYARTSGGLANQSRTASANLRDLAGTIGQSLAPAVNTLAKGLNDVLGTLNSLRDEGPPVVVPDATAVALVPKLAHEYQVMRDHGVAAGDAIKYMERQLGNSANAALILGQAINYAAGGATVAKIEKLTAALHPEAGPHDLPTHQVILGRSALGPMQRNQLALSAAQRTRGTQDNLAALVTRRELLAKAIRTETARLNNATTRSAAKSFAAALQRLQDEDAAAMNQMIAITKKQAGKTPTELAQQRNMFFDNAITRMLDRVSDISSMGGKIAALQRVNALITQRIAVTKDITRKLRLEDQVTANLREIAADRVQQQQDVIDALSLNIDRAGLTKTLTDDIAAYRVVNAKLAQQQQQFGYTTDRERQIIGNLQTIQADRQEMAQAAHDALSARQFAALRLGPTGEELTPGVKALQRQAAAVQKAVGSMGDAKTRQTLTRIRRVLGGGIGQVTEEVRAKIKELLDAFGKNVDPLAGLRQVSSKQLAATLAAGTGLGAAGRRVLSMNIAGAEIQPVHVHVHLDGREVATVVSKQQARTSRRTAQQTSGFRG